MKLNRALWGGSAATGLAGKGKGPVANTELFPLVALIKH